MIIKLVEETSRSKHGSDRVVYFDVDEISKIKVVKHRDSKTANIVAHLKSGDFHSSKRGSFEETCKIVERLYCNLKSGLHIYDL